MSLIIFPIVALTGFWMWQAPRLNKWVKQLNNSKIEIGKET
jgi:hypothetical protein